MISMHSAGGMALDNPNTYFGLAHGSVRNLVRLYGSVLVVTGAMLVALFALRQIWPFGDNVLRYHWDGGQYYGFLGYFQRTLLSNDDLLFSWSAVLGGNMAGILAYYCASPFNLLSVFFPGNLMAAYHCIFVAKFMSAAICFAVMLRGMFGHDHDKSVILFSASYPYIGYMTFFAWNQTWMDAVVFLPLIVLGIWNIVQGHQPWLYVLSLAVTLFANYYIGYMVCITSALTFAGYLVISQKKEGLPRICGCYVLASLGAVALVAVLLLPTYAALPRDRLASWEQLTNATFVSQPDEILSMLYTAPYANMEWYVNYPVIYSGAVQLVLVVLFFLNGSILPRYKLAAGGLLVLLALSFSVSPLNVIWHGFTKNAGINFRYSFVVSFLLELLAFYSFTHIVQAKNHLLVAGAILAGMTVIATQTTKGNVGPGTLLLDAVTICVALLLISKYSSDVEIKNTKGGTIVFFLLATLMLSNLLYNSVLSLDGINDGGSLSRYTDAQTTDAEIAAIIDDDGFYRMGSTWTYGQCDAMRAGYAGLNNYASSENPEAIEVVRRLGARTINVHSMYGANVPVSTDVLLGLKYVVAPNDSFKSGIYTTKGEISEKNLAVYENEYALPLLMPGETYLDANDPELNNFEYSNRYWNSLASEGGDVFTRDDFTMTTQPSQDGNVIQISFEASADGPVYAYVPQGKIKVDAPFDPAANYQDVFCLGEFTAGETGELTITTDGSYSGEDLIAIYSERLNVLKKKAEEVLSNDIQIEKLTSSHLKMRYSAAGDGFVTSTIPFNEGWHVYVDGVEVETYRNMDTFLAFDIKDGSHEIELIFWPPYFWPGVIISVSSALLMCGISYRTRRARHRVDRVKEQTTPPHLKRRNTKRTTAQPTTVT